MDPWFVGRGISLIGPPSGTEGGYERDVRRADAWRAKYNRLLNGHVFIGPTVSRTLPLMPLFEYYQSTSTPPISANDADNYVSDIYNRHGEPFEYYVQINGGASSNNKGIVSLPRLGDIPRYIKRNIFYAASTLSFIHFLADDLQVSNGAVVFNTILKGTEAGVAAPVNDDIACKHICDLAKQLLTGAKNYNDNVSHLYQRVLALASWAIKDNNNNNNNNMRGWERSPVPPPNRESLFGDLEWQGILDALMYTFPATPDTLDETLRQFDERDNNKQKDSLNKWAKERLNAARRYIDPAVMRVIMRHFGVEATIDGLDWMDCVRPLRRSEANIIWRNRSMYVWLWFHITATATRDAPKSVKATLIELFSAMSLFLVCNLCRYHFETDVLPFAIPSDLITTPGSDALELFIVRAHKNASIPNNNNNKKEPQLSEFKDSGDTPSATPLESEYISDYYNWWRAAA